MNQTSSRACGASLLCCPPSRFSSRKLGPLAWLPSLTVFEICATRSPSKNRFPGLWSLRGTTHQFQTRISTLLSLVWTRDSLVGCRGPLSFSSAAERPATIFQGLSRVLRGVLLLFLQGHTRFGACRSRVLHSAPAWSIAASSFAPTPPASGPPTTTTSNKPHNQTTTTNWLEHVDWVFIWQQYPYRPPQSNSLPCLLGESPCLATPMPPTRPCEPLRLPSRAPRRAAPTPICCARRPTDSLPQLSDR